jgi:hypothetical protein
MKNKSIEEQVKSIEEKKRLQELAGVKSSIDNNAEELWEKLQKEMEDIIDLAKNKPNE